MPYRSMYSPSTGDTYTDDESGQWYRVCHYTHEWTTVDAPPADARPMRSDVRTQEAQAAVG